MTPGSYQLVVSRELATTAREILNTAGSRATTYAADGSNSAKLNTFDFEGNTVEIVELPFIGYTKRGWGTVGSDADWFVLNSEAISRAGAARIISLYDADVRVWENYDNGNTMVWVDMGFAVDHYGLESYAVWYIA